ncbi:Hint domain-containing protein [Nioella sp. MMSF_3534]|uniref:Hint domain-containing protein n=1 Tax=Nioella sp. MMSF_3534 TaxID=3046720 RepID=UPI00273E3D72|nr:Hint domain-containing protein [Nioella sp. MMSF_3534]
MDDANNDGFVSGVEWDAAISGGGNDTGSSNYLFDGNGSSGQLYATDGTTTFIIGQDVTILKAGLSNTFEADVTDVICLTRGTLVLTDTGWTAIEEIAVGRGIATAEGEIEKVRWIGRNLLGLDELKRAPKLRPVRITAGALGQGLPWRDLLVSPQHRMLVRSAIARRMFGCAEVLIPAIKLTSLPGIYIDTKIEWVEYFHILLNQHEIIFAEGAQSESLYTGPQALIALSSDAREEILSIFPELKDQSHDPRPARHIPSGTRQKKLIARHRTNRQPLLQEIEDEHMTCEERATEYRS